MRGPDPRAPASSSVPGLPCPQVASWGFCRAMPGFGLPIGTPGWELPGDTSAPLALSCLQPTPLQVLWVSGNALASFYHSSPIAALCLGLRQLCHWPWAASSSSSPKSALVGDRCWVGSPTAHTSTIHLGAHSTANSGCMMWPVAPSSVQSTRGTARCGSTYTSSQHLGGKGKKVTLTLRPSWST